MTVSDWFLLFFSIGALWTAISWMVGGLHLTHGHAFHHSHGGHAVSHSVFSWLGALANPTSIAVFFAWFGGVGYLLTRHSGLELWLDLTVAAGFGAVGAWLVAALLRFLQAREKPLDPADYEMIGTLGRVSCPVRPDGVGELIYTREGARKLVPARSEDGSEIPRGSEAIVTRFEKGIAYIRTWDALLPEPGSTLRPQTLPKKGTPNVQ